MKHTAVRALILSVALTFSRTEAICLPASLQADEPLLIRILIEEISTTEKAERVETLLKMELERSGFVIVEDRAGADATLTGSTRDRPGL